MDFDVFGMQGIPPEFLAERAAKKLRGEDPTGQAAGAAGAMMGGMVPPGMPGMMPGMVPPGYPPYGYPGAPPPGYG